MVRLVEKHLRSKTGDQSGGEDRLVCGPNFFGVIDGATDKTGNDWGNGKTGGQVIAEIVQAVLTKASGDESPKDLVSTMNRAIHNAAKDAGIDLEVVANRADAAFAAFVPSKNAVYHIHDCSFGFVMDDGRFMVHKNQKLVDELTSDLRAATISLLNRHGIDPFAGGQDMGRGLIFGMLERQKELQNVGRNCEGQWFGIPRRLLAYKTLNGFPTSLAVTKVPRGACEVVLASDGFKELRPTLSETLAVHDWLQKQDPACIGLLKGTKRVANLTYDDTSYIRVEVTVHGAGGKK